MKCDNTAGACNSGTIKNSIRWRRSRINSNLADAVLRASACHTFQKSGYPVPATRISSTLSSFVPRSIVLWNTLPKEIQESKTLTNFKTRLRTHLHIWCQQSHSLNSRWSALLLIFLKLTYFLRRLYLLFFFILPGTSTLAGEQLWQVYMLLFCNPRKIYAMKWNARFAAADRNRVALIE